LLLPYADVAITVGPIPLGSAHIPLAQSAAATGDLDLAATHFEDALAIDTRTGARTWLAHSQYEYAKLLLTRRASGDDARAAALIDQALAATREIGMPALEARLVTLEGAAHPKTAPVSVGASYPDDLTQREVEVLRLLAAGRTNQEIADTLFISPSTAAHHVSSIMSKIGAANRTAAANYAHSHGLI
jgi:DNA-binding NarL/FixJ family response regulator